jgi:host factor-I protein
MFLAKGGLAYLAGLQSNRAAVRANGTFARAAAGGSATKANCKPIRQTSSQQKYKDTDHLTGTTTMAADRAQNLQDTFLNHVRKTKTPLTIFLVNGVKLQGIVTWFDNFCLLLRRDGHSQLVYKHAISTIMPGAPIQLFEGNEDNAT